ncbi:efflux RND transporter periplasmic adaptor subunit [Flavonifractor porci]|uniref:efflux RND transporter periplasmic adaptor subunit n=1 Tax=Flavonifractor porci TaxID=3133422 RepID=UPI003094F91C
MLVQLQQQIADGSAQVGDLEEKVERLQIKINQNILEIGRLNEELLKVDDGSDERNTLNNQIANLQYDIQKLNGQLSEKAALAANNVSQIQSLEVEIQNLKEQLAGLDTSDPENEQKIQELQQQIAANQQKIRQLSYTDEIDALNSQIIGKESQLRKAQEEINFLSDGSEERNAIQLEITKLQNENTAMQQEIDAYMEDPAFAELERLKGEQQTCEDSLKSDYEALSLKLEEMERAEKLFQQALENQNGDNAFLDYKTSEELKAINENIAKASRNVQAAQEKVSRLQALSQNPTIYAQLDGIVTTLNYKVGDTVADGKPLCIVGELDEITMTVPVSAADIGSVSVGQKVNIYVDAYAEQKFTGTVKERLLVANDNGEYPVTITIDPGEQMLLPGMKAYATIILKEKTDVLTLSNKAITLENGQQYVLVRDENEELVRKQIVTGFSDGRVSEILDGLSENEVVIVQE